MNRYIQGIFFFLTFFAFASLHSVASADDAPVTWEELDETCFRESIEFSPDQDGVTKLNLIDRADLFLVQEGQILPYRNFRHGTETYFPYSVQGILGADADAKENIAFLSDGNPQTGLAFNPYSNDPKQIVIDLGQMIAGGSLSVRLYFDGELFPAYFISKDGSDYIQVERPEQFDFRFLRIDFLPSSEADQTANALTVTEVEIVTAGNDVLLANLPSKKGLRAYSDFQCDHTDILRKALVQLNSAASTVSYQIDAETPELAGIWVPNDEYDPDLDSDGVLNEIDNCPHTANADQGDLDGDLKGDACDLDNSTKNFLERDSDQDGVGNQSDNCPYIYNPRQEDGNADKRGDLCADDDGDGIIGYQDNCIKTANPDQQDVNINGVGDACEFDFDQDGIFDSIDNCRSVSNPTQFDADNDGIGDSCDNCELYNPNQNDTDRNGRGDVCERNEEYRQTHDEDGDGVLDATDICPQVPDPEQIDTDKDGIGDQCDNCPRLQNGEQEDKNKNGIGDMCEDTDNDGIEGYLDNCPYQHNPDQADTDNDGLGDPCEDDDQDGIIAAEDNCPFANNRDQRDTDGDGFGDVCDTADSRLLESNKWIVAGLIAAVAVVFGWLIFVMARKLK